MGRRARYDTLDVLEPLAALLRQSTTRAIERLRLHNNNTDKNSSMSTVMTGGGVAAARARAQNMTRTATSTALRPMDVLVVQYCMYYLDVHTLPPSHYLRLAQDVVTASAERVLLPRLFSKAPSLPLLCEGIVAEHTADAVTATMTEVDAFVEARALLGQWVAEQQQLLADGSEGDDDDEHGGDGYGGGGGRSMYAPRHRPRYDTVASDEDDNKDDTQATALGGRNDRDVDEREAALDVVAGVYASLEYWVRVHTFLDKLSLGSATVNAHTLQPRYERELLLLLHKLASSSSTRQRRAEGVAAAVAVRGARDVKTEEVRAAGAGAAAGAVVADADTAAIDNENKKGTTMTRMDVKEEVTDTLDDDAAAAAMRHVTARDVVPSDDAVEYSGADEEKAAATAARGDGDNNDNDDDSNDDDDDDEGAVAVRTHQSQLATAVLGDVLALSVRPTSLSLAVQQQQQQQQQQPAAAQNALAVALRTAATTPTTTTQSSPTTLQQLPGISASYYDMVHARLGVMLARNALYRYGRRAAHAAPELTPQQRETAAQEQLRRQQQQQYTLLASTAGLHGGQSAGVPVDYVPDDHYYEQLLEQQSEFVDEDEELYKDEVVDYYLRKQQQQQQQQQRASATRRNDRRHNNSGSGAGTTASPETLVKPHRFCKVKTGFTWTQYNRTHYDSRTNPPPRTVLWYEFTLFYPALVHTKRDMRHIFHIEELPHGPSEDYCLLVFSVGPPYADVAYRIVKKQWDTRRGGVRISFDATGRYKLFFRFTNSNYRR